MKMFGKFLAIIFLFACGSAMYDGQIKAWGVSTSGGGNVFEGTYSLEKAFQVQFGITPEILKTLSVDQFLELIQHRRDVQPPQLVEMIKYLNEKQNSQMEFFQKLAKNFQTATTALMFMSVAEFLIIAVLIMIFIAINCCPVE